ncbi:hypothetical protein AQUCO_10400002v1 [Aquilegia coerulea]|uniref:(+)-delta-cadinene synthase n=1 Tax=Aquilegia coerulea TaxID=218851 RepID=A0A2G5C3S0_AQUCA|nr:hypothetical protein AQUCO_10400002v1 [Aquilegia coerulea]
MAALSCTFMPLSVFGHPPSSRLAMNPRLVGNLPSSSRSAINPCLKNLATKCSDATNASSLDATPEIIRHFHPSVWEGHDFTLAPISSDLIDESRLKELKNEVKSILSIAVADSLQELDLIDKIQRLGVAYHFEDEIKDVLQRTYNNDYAHFFDQHILNDHEHADLCYVSLRFRLLRQAGYYVSPGVFKMFKSEKGEFHANLASDVQGMLSLYEASYLGFNGEDILDEAMAFTTKHLNSMLTCLSPPLALQVQHALTMPLQRSVERVYSRYYISIYKQDISRNEALYEFAKLDFNFLQLLLREEINEVQGWWERMNIKSKLRFDFRDRVVEAYTIASICISSEPQFSQGRIHLAKLWTMLSVVDDAFDVFGKLDELEPLCDAFQRWDANNTSKLSYSMKVVFLEWMNFYNAIETDMNIAGNVIGLSYFKEKIQVHIKNLLEEVKVVFSENLPTLEEWLRISVPTIVVSLNANVATMNMGEFATKEVFDWIAGMPKIVECSNLFIRLVGDVASLQVEQERGTDASCVPCYMKEHRVSESEATENIQQMITSVWKVMNEEGLRVHPVPMKVVKILINFNRSIGLHYAGNVDGHTVSDGRTKDIITMLFIDPIPI